MDEPSHRRGLIGFGRNWVEEHQFARFLISGGVNTGVTYLIYVGLVLFLAYPVAYTVTTVLGIVSSYVLNAQFVFRRKLSVNTALRYPIVYVAQYVLGLILLYLLVEKARISKFVAPILIVTATVPLNYVLSRYVIGRDGPAARSARGR
jgi:putative flippase GtrA